MTDIGQIIGLVACVVLPSIAIVILSKRNWNLLDTSWYYNTREEGLR